MESNEVIDSNPYSVARVSSTLLVSRAAGRDQYTCLVTAGAKTARATTVVYSQGTLNGYFLQQASSRRAPSDRIIARLQAKKW